MCARKNSSFHLFLRNNQSCLRKNSLQMAKLYFYSKFNQYALVDGACSGSSPKNVELARSFFGVIIDFCEVKDHFARKSGAYLWKNTPIKRKPSPFLQSFFCYVCLREPPSYSLKYFMLQKVYFMHIFIFWKTKAHAALLIGNGDDLAHGRTPSFFLSYISETQYA